MAITDERIKELIEGKVGYLDDAILRLNELEARSGMRLEANLYRNAIGILNDDLAALRELLALREQNRWIPTSEKLPADGDVIEICDAQEPEWMKLGKFRSGYLWTFSITPEKWSVKEFTHWRYARPLPAPPLEG